METEQFSAGWKLNQDRSHGREWKTFWIEWQWKHSVPKPMGHNESGSKGTCIALNEHLHFILCSGTPKNSRAMRRNNPEKDYVGRNNST